MQGLKAIHDAGVLHGDVALRNLLIDSSRVRGGARRDCLHEYPLPCLHKARWGALVMLQGIHMYP